MALIGFGGGLFAHGTLTASMAFAKPEDRGLALGAWGAAQSTAAGLAIAFSGVVNDLGSSLASRGAFGDALADPVTGYTIVYSIEISLLVATLIVIGPLVRARMDMRVSTRANFGPAVVGGASVWRFTAMRGAVGNLDVAQIVLYAFWLFFFGLLFYLRREDRREGYPLESEAEPGLKARDIIWIPRPKTFRRSDGREVSVPNFRADTRPINATKTEPWPGAPLQPNGDPMLAAVGPGSYAERADETYKTADGHDLIVPLRVATNYGVPADSANPIGFAVWGADRAQAGTVRDLWVDRAECMLRYYEVETADGKRVLLPVNFANVDAKRRRIGVNALLAGQFAAVPAIRNPDKVTLLEEDKITAYYGAGTLYATAARAEPLL